MSLIECFFPESRESDQLMFHFDLANATPIQSVCLASVILRVSILRLLLFYNNGRVFNSPYFILNVVKRVFFFSSSHQYSAGCLPIAIKNVQQAAHFSYG